MAEHPSTRPSRRIPRNAYLITLSLLSVAIVGQPASAVSDPSAERDSRIGGQREASTRLGPEPGVSVIANAPRASMIFGPGIAIDAKSNRRVTRDVSLAHRFRAKATSAVVAILFQPRWGKGYSIGDGGRYRVSIQSDDGRGRPSGLKLASFTWSPGNKGSQGKVRRFTFPRPPRLRRGKIYHVVFKNIHPRANSNYISINETFTYEPLAPRHPRFRDGVYAVLNGARTSGSGWKWSVDRHHMADMDLVYANGKHEGMAYLAAMIHDWAPIGGARMVRERFKVKNRSHRVTGACVRIGRQAGSGPLTMTLETASGRKLRSATVSTDRVARTSPGKATDNGDWVCQGFGRSVRIRKAKAYALRLSAPSGSQFSMTPILARDHTTDDKSYRMESYRFRGGVAERSGNSGRSWSAMYPWYPNDIQFYLKTK